MKAKAGSPTLSHPTLEVIRVPAPKFWWGPSSIRVLDESSDTEEQVLSLWCVDLGTAQPTWQKLSDIPYSTEFLTNDFYVSPAGNVMIRRADTYHFSVNGASWYQDTKTTGFYPVGTFSDGFILVSDHNVQFHRPSTAEWHESSLNGLEDNVSVRRVERTLWRRLATRLLE